MVWNQEDNIYGCRILPDGTVLDSGGFVICADSFQQVDPAITSDGRRFLVTWTDSRADNYDIYGVFVDSLANVDILENFSSPIKNNLSIKIFPNPFIDKVEITKNSAINHLTIYDISGKLVKSFTDLSKKIVWDGKDNQGQTVPNGVYFLELQTNHTSLTHRVIKLN